MLPIHRQPRSGHVAMIQSALIAKESYFDSFRQRFVSSAVHFGLTVKPTEFTALEELLSQIDSSGQLALYL
jgi:hypothetical protein